MTVLTTLPNPVPTAPPTPDVTATTACVTTTVANPVVMTGVTGIGVTDTGETGVTETAGTVTVTNVLGRSTFVCVGRRLTVPPRVAPPRMEFW